MPEALSNNRKTTNSHPSPSELTLVRVDTAADLPDYISRTALAEYLHVTMKPYEDTVPDILRGLDYALSGPGGFILLAEQRATIVGAVVILQTGMAGYVPENLLLFIAVTPDLRGQGIGGILLKAAQEACTGSLCLHVEPDNPAKRLYERNGFENKYLEMRFVAK